jgi:hypothetical protein
MRRTLLPAAIALALVVASTARAYPAITCGRMSYGGQHYIIKSHGPSCPFAIRNLKAYMAHRTSPRLFKCRRYGANIPAYCVGTGKYSKRYFFASEPSETPS